MTRAAEEAGDILRLSVEMDPGNSAANDAHAQLHPEETDLRQPGGPQ